MQRNPVIDYPFINYNVYLKDSNDMRSWMTAESQFRMELDFM